MSLQVHVLLVHSECSSDATHSFVLLQFSPIWTGIGVVVGVVVVVGIVAIDVVVVGVVVVSVVVLEDVPTVVDVEAKTT